MSSAWEQFPEIVTEGLGYTRGGEKRRWLTYWQASQRLGVDTDTVKRLAEKHGLPTYRVVTMRGARRDLVTERDTMHPQTVLASEALPMLRTIIASGER